MGLPIDSEKMEVFAVKRSLLGWLFGFLLSAFLIALGFVDGVLSVMHNAEISVDGNEIRIEYAGHVWIHSGEGF